MVRDPAEAFHAARQRRELWLYVIGAVASLVVGLVVVYVMWGTGELDTDRIIDEAQHNLHRRSGGVYGAVIGLGFVALSVLLAWRAWRLARDRSQ